MTASDNGELPRLEAALAAASTEEGADQSAVLREIAAGEILLPQTTAPSDKPSDQITLPLIEHDGTTYVAAFTSPARLAEGAPDAPSYAVVRGADLGAAWPEQDLWLALNPGTESGATVPPDTVRLLPTMLG